MLSYVCQWSHAQREERFPEECLEGAGQSPGGWTWTSGTQGTWPHLVHLANSANLLHVQLSCMFGHYHQRYITLHYWHWALILYNPKQTNCYVFLSQSSPCSVHEYGLTVMSFAKYSSSFSLNVNPSLRCCLSSWLCRFPVTRSCGSSDIQRIFPRPRLQRTT